jgi:thiol-disulfide isomerase/thioredoxin
MVSKKSKKLPSRKTVRRHKKSTSGKIKVPLDVRSEKDLLPLKKLLQKKPLTIILVYATWCPHCHKMMPHFDEAAKSPKNTVSAVKINETMLNSVNNFVKKNVNKDAEPISVKGYPSIILVNKKAEKVTDLEPVRDTDVMKKVMEESGNLAVTAGIDESLHLNKNKVNRNKSASQVVEDVIEKNLVNVSSNTGLAEKINLANSNKNASMENKGNKGNKKESMENATAPSPLNSFAVTNGSIKANGANGANGKSLNLLPTKEMKEEAEQLESISGPVYPVSPPSPNSSNDVDSVIISNKLSPAQKVGGGRGGSLFEAMTRTTYTLAPAAALLATAAMVMRNSHRRTHKKSGKTVGKRDKNKSKKNKRNKSKKNKSKNKK